MLGRLQRFAAIAIAVAFAVPAFSQNPSSKPIRVIVPYAPGGLVDASMRVLAPKMGDLLGQPVVVDNRSGAGGIIGMAEVARSAPDGNTLLFANDSVALVPHTFANLAFDPVKDFSPVTQVLSVPLVLLVHPSVPVNSLRELSVYSKENAGKLSAGGITGTTTQLCLEMFKSVSGADIQFVPYKGAAPALTDFIAGQTQVMAVSTTVSLPHVRSGKAKALAVASAHRASNMPEIPTTADAGYRGVEFSVWMGILGPSKMSAPLVQRLRAAAVRSLNEPANVKRFIDQGMDVLGTTPEEFGRFIALESAKFGRIVAQAGIKPE